MASVRKRGNSYQITVSVGRDMYGKKIVETATFTPDPGTGKREEKQALNQFVADFETYRKECRAYIRLRP